MTKQRTEAQKLATRRAFAYRRYTAMIGLLLSMARDKSYPDEIRANFAFCAKYLFHQNKSMRMQFKFKDPDKKLPPTWDSES